MKSKNSHPHVQSRVSATAIGVATAATLLAGFIWLNTAGDSNPPVSLAPVADTKWMLVTRTADGTKLADQPGALMVVTSEGRMQHHVPDSANSTLVSDQFCRFSWQPDHTEFELSTTENWSNIRRGIARLKGDHLTLCIAPEGHPRPAAFTTGNMPTKGYLLYEFQKAP